jgi:hypothetical protein
LPSAHNTTLWASAAITPDAVFIVRRYVGKVFTFRADPAAA